MEFDDERHFKDEYHGRSLKWRLKEWKKEFFYYSFSLTKRHSIPKLRQPILGFDQDENPISLDETFMRRFSEDVTKLKMQADLVKTYTALMNTICLFLIAVFSLKSPFTPNDACDYDGGLSSTCFAHIVLWAFLLRVIFAVFVEITLAHLPDEERFFVLFLGRMKVAKPRKFIFRHSIYLAPSIRAIIYSAFLSAASAVYLGELFEKGFLLWNTLLLLALVIAAIAPVSQEKDAVAGGFWHHLIRLPSPTSFRSADSSWLVPWCAGQLENMIRKLDLATPTFRIEAVPSILIEAISALLSQHFDFSFHREEEKRLIDQILVQLKSPYARSSTVKTLFYPSMHYANSSFLDKSDTFQTLFTFLNFLVFSILSLPVILGHILFRGVYHYIQIARVLLSDEAVCFGNLPSSTISNRFIKLWPIFIQDASEPKLEKNYTISSSFPSSLKRSHTGKPLSMAERYLGRFISFDELETRPGTEFPDSSNNTTVELGDPLLRTFSTAEYTVEVPELLGDRTLRRLIDSVERVSFLQHNTDRFLAVPALLTLIIMLPLNLIAHFCSVLCQGSPPQRLRYNKLFLQYFRISLPLWLVIEPPSPFHFVHTVRFLLFVILGKIGSLDLNNQLPASVQRLLGSFYITIVKVSLQSKCSNSSFFTLFHRFSPSWIYNLFLFEDDVIVRMEQFTGNSWSAWLSPKEALELLRLPHFKLYLKGSSLSSVQLSYSKAHEEFSLKEPWELLSSHQETQIVFLSAIIFGVTARIYQSLQFILRRIFHCFKLFVSITISGGLATFQWIKIFMNTLNKRCPRTTDMIPTFFGKLGFQIHEHSMEIPHSITLEDIYCHAPSEEEQHG